MLKDFVDSFEKYDFPNVGWTRLPKPPITKEDKERFDSNENESNSLFLRKLCMVGFATKLKSGKIPKTDYQKYIDKCEFELKTFDELHFTDYILLVWKVLEKARELGVFIDYGRGSIGSSLVAWLLGISGCDPIKYKLFFSRFVSKARAESKIIDGEVWISIALAPDIDINLGDGREAIVSWLKEIYPNRICKISNVSTLTGKILVKDVYKTYNEASEEQAKEISDMIERRFGVVQDIEKTYKENSNFKQWADRNKETYEICLQLRDLIRGTSTHASGYLVSYEELTEHTPLVLDSAKDEASNYTMDDVQCLKLDLLGLDTNRVLRTIIDEVKIDTDTINLDDDPLIYNQFQNNNLLPYGLYQISADCTYRVCMNLKPKNVLELSHVNAISRPVALAYEKPYLANESKCPHPLFEEALKWTNYQPLYQEQTLMCLRAIGFDEIEAENARRIFAKKKHHETEGQVEKIKQKIQENNLPKEAADVVIKLAEDGANYQFNLSHSLSTSYLSALTVYLKYKYPIQFYTACLNEVRHKPNFTEEIHKIVSELSQFNLELRPPTIDRFSPNFTHKDNTIYYGISSIKGISDKTLEKLKNFQINHNDKFDLFKATIDAGLSADVVGAMIMVGCLNEQKFQVSRQKLLLEFQLYKLLTPKEQKICAELGKSFDFDLIKILKHLNTEKKDEKSRAVLKDSRLATIKKHYLPFWEMYKANSKNEQLCRWFFEKKFLGFSYSTTLKEIYSKYTDNLMTIREVLAAEPDDNVKIICEIQEFIERKSQKTGKLYWRMTTTDETASIRIILASSEKHDKVEEALENNARKPREGDICIFKARKGQDDICFASFISVQEIEILDKPPKIKT